MGYSEPVRVCDYCWERIKINQQSKIAKLISSNSLANLASSSSISHKNNENEKENENHNDNDNNDNDNKNDNDNDNKNDNDNDKDTNNTNIRPPAPATNDASIAPKDVLSSSILMPIEDQQLNENDRQSSNDNITQLQQWQSHSHTELNATDFSQSQIADIPNTLNKNASTSRSASVVDSQPSLESSDSNSKSTRKKKGFKFKK